MGARSGGRIVALHVLFGLEAAGALEGERRTAIDVDGALARYWGSFEDHDAHAEDLDPEARSFGDALVRELVDRLDPIDDLLRKASTNWRLERMPGVDRAVLRLAAFELMWRPDVPRAVAIDEAVELAKRFGGEDSARFVNGILERVADDVGRLDPRREPDGTSRPDGGGGGRSKGRPRRGGGR